MSSCHDSREILVLPERCLGCGLCEWACRQVLSERDRGGGSAGEVRPGIDLRFFGPVPSPLICRHCEQAPCLEACIAGALKRDPASGRVTHDPERCVSCWMCVMSCPSGAISAVEGEGARKCSGCPDRKEPACVDACPARALVYEVPLELESARQRSAYPQIRPRAPRARHGRTGTTRSSPTGHAGHILTGAAALAGFARRAVSQAAAGRADESAQEPHPHPALLKTFSLHMGFEWTDADGMEGRSRESITLATLAHRNLFEARGHLDPWLAAILGKTATDRLARDGLVPGSILNGLSDLHTALQSRAAPDEAERLTIPVSLGALISAGLIAVFATPPALESYLRSFHGSSGSNHRGRLIFTMERESRVPEVLVMPASPLGRIYEASAFIAGVMAWNVMRDNAERPVELRLPRRSDTLLEAVACALSAAGHTVLAT